MLISFIKGIDSKFPNYFVVIEIIFEITKYTLSTEFIETALLITLSLFVVLSIRLYQISTEFKNNLIEQLFYLVVLAIVFKASSLIWGFTIYFIFWHSIPSLNDQLIFLYGSSTWADFKKYFNYLKQKYPQGLLFSNMF